MAQSANQKLQAVQAQLMIECEEQLSNLEEHCDWCSKAVQGDETHATVVKSMHVKVATIRRTLATLALATYGIQPKPVVAVKPRIVAQELQITKS